MIKSNVSSGLRIPCPQTKWSQRRYLCMTNANESSSPEEILSAAFSHAKLLLRSIVKPQDYESLFPFNGVQDSQSVSSNSIVDVQHCLEDAQNVYNCRTGRTEDEYKIIDPTTAVPSNTPTNLSKAKAKIQRWLTGLSQKLLYYGNIFDVMAQHHPEYVALAWGTFKLLFVVGLFFLHTGLHIVFLVAFFCKRIYLL